MPDELSDTTKQTPIRVIAVARTNRQSTIDGIIHFVLWVSSRYSFLTASVMLSFIIIPTHQPLIKDHLTLWLSVLGLPPVMLIWLDYVTTPAIRLYERRWSGFRQATLIAIWLALIAIIIRIALEPNTAIVIGTGIAILVAGLAPSLRRAIQGFPQDVKKDALAMWWAASLVVPASPARRRHPATGQEPIPEAPILMQRIPRNRR